MGRFRYKNTKTDCPESLMDSSILGCGDCLRFPFSALLFSAPFVPMQGWTMRDLDLFCTFCADARLDKCTQNSPVFDLGTPTRNLKRIHALRNAQVRRRRGR